MIARRRPVCGLNMACLMEAAEAEGRSDHSNAIAPLTKGAAMLVPPEIAGSPSKRRLVTPAPGPASPRRPIDAPRFETPIGAPIASHPVTGMTQG